MLLIFDRIRTAGQRGNHRLTEPVSRPGFFSAAKVVPAIPEPVGTGTRDQGAAQLSAAAPLVLPRSHSGWFRYDLPIGNRNHLTLSYTGAKTCKACASPDERPWSSPSDSRDGIGLLSHSSDGNTGSHRAHVGAQLRTKQKRHPGLRSGVAPVTLPESVAPRRSVAQWVPPLGSRSSGGFLLRHGRLAGAHGVTPTKSARAGQRRSTSCAERRTYRPRSIA